MNFDMKRSFNPTGFVADPDPNVTPPTVGQIINVGSPAVGQGLYFAAWVDGTKVTTVPGALFDFTGWWLDQGSGLWVKMEPETGALAFKSFKIGLADQMWIQVNATTPGASTYAEIWAGARDVI
jgi:hypothetical protein